MAPLIIELINQISLSYLLNGKREKKYKYRTFSPIITF